MAIFHSISLTTAVLLFAGNSAVSATLLAPAQDIVLPSTDSASDPLTLLGANSPYFAGPNINGISNEVPEGCEVEQVAYIVRHGSRFPDSGAYAQWVALYTEIQDATFEATGSMAFLKHWKPVLTNPALEMSQESPTGYKEAYDLGYTLRTRYPSLYSYGQNFISWANDYPRVIQTAQNFVRGFLGQIADNYGLVISVNSTGSEEALFDSLSPSDLCPLFIDGNGGTEQASWNALYLPIVKERIQSMITGNLNFSTTDVSIMPYLCGFESQITGTLSPWCNVFTDAELAQYEYSQDLRYYYGMGPGTDLPSKMMLPFVNSLVGLLADGPGKNGTFANGTSFTLPSILTAFVNDGQITEVGSAIGVWDDTISLGDGTYIPDGYTYKASHFVTMRGTVAFERLNCKLSTPAKREEGHLAKRGFVTETRKRTTTITVCPTETPIFTTFSNVLVPVQSSLPATVVTSNIAAGYTTSTYFSTHTYTITSCAATVTNCPVGKVTETVKAYTTVCPVTEAQGSATSISSSGSSSITAGNGSGSGSDSTVSSSDTRITAPSTSSGSGSGLDSNSTITIASSSYSSSIYSSISGFTNATSISSGFANSTASSTSSSASATATSASTNQTYLRILLNDAVYPIPSCKSGPGSSCLLSDYVAFIAARLEAAGDLPTRCNVTAAGAPTAVKGASFFTDLSDSWLTEVSP